MQFYITQKNLIVFQRAYLEILDSVLGFFDCFFFFQNFSGKWSYVSILIADFCFDELLNRLLYAQSSSTYDDLMKKHPHNIVHICIHAKVN